MFLFWLVYKHTHVNHSLFLWLRLLLLNELRPSVEPQPSWNKQMNGDYEFRKEIVGGRPFDTFQWIQIDSSIRPIGSERNQQTSWLMKLDGPASTPASKQFFFFFQFPTQSDLCRTANQSLFILMEMVKWMRNCIHYPFWLHMHMHRDQTIFRDCEIAFGKRFSFNIFIWCFNISFDRPFREFYRFAFPANRNSGKSTWNWSRQTSSFMITNDLLPNRSM